MSSIPVKNTDVLVLGSSIAACMTAAWLRHVQPDLSVTVIGPPVGVEKRPIVGESLVEPAILFFRALGLGPYLEQRHVLKNGLTFYHKLAPDDPGDRRYTAHMPMTPLHHLARQLHRPAFDIELGRHAARLGAEFVEGQVTEIELGTAGARHVVHAGEQRFSAQFLIDATGRRRMVGQKVTRYERPTTGQRSVFWFWLADHEPLLSRLELSWRRPAEYDLWQSTHHFMGKGNWIWGIPLRDDDGKPLLSMGITWRPDVFTGDVRTLADFLAWVDGEHPAIGEIVRSGRVLDTNHYRNYLYKAEQVYSDDNWFLVGDAARSVDPLYSTGLSMTVIQVEQIAEIIRRRRGPGIDAAAIRHLQDLWKQVADLRQVDITDQYVTMGDPFQACMRRYWNICGFFNGVLPLWHSGYFTDPEAARVLRRFFVNGLPSTRAAWRLFGEVARELGEVEQADFDRTTDLDWLINRRFDRPPETVPRQLGHLMWKRACLRTNLLRMGGWRSLPSQAPHLLRELVLAGALPTLLFRHPALRNVQGRRQLPGPKAVSA
jgi:2-polyprenyl-6-methoxyphenol hydroxylase-like FAD-dependent oxidoreductase